MDNDKKTEVKIFSNYSEAITDLYQQINRLKRRIAELENKTPKQPYGPPRPPTQSDQCDSFSDESYLPEVLKTIAASDHNMLQ